MQNLDLDMIRINISDSMVSSFEQEVDDKNVYANDVLDTSLTWLSYNLSYCITTLLSKEEIKQNLIDFLWKIVPKPSPTSWIHSYIPFAFNWALKSVITLVVNKIFSLIFVGSSLELNPKYVQNNLGNIT